VDVGVELEVLAIGVEDCDYPWDYLEGCPPVVPRL